MGSIAALAGFRWNDAVVDAVVRETGGPARQAVLVAAKGFDDGNRYLKREELRRGAQRLLATPSGSATGARFSPAVLAQVMSAYGLRDAAALLAAALAHDDGNRYLKRAELEAAAAGLASAAVLELGLVSDLDKTVIPPEDNGLPAAAYPGVAQLYSEIEHQDGGEPGDVYYVTARNPIGIQEIPAWLAQHGLPQGAVESGTMDFSQAEQEKVRDIQRILDAHPGQKFLLFGDTNHRDPDVYRTVIANNPGRIVGGFIHDVKKIPAARLEGLFLYSNYAMLAGELLRRGILDVAAARRVMLAAQREGLAVSDAEIARLLDE